MSKKIISFSLWCNEKRNKELNGGIGDTKYYLYGAIMNAHLAKTIYPGWIVRYYCGNTVPTLVKDMLREMGNTEIIEMNEEGDWTASFWRFYPAGNSDVDVMLSRDVDEWLASDKAFHTMRDNIAHNLPILAGMWGAKKGCISNMTELCEQFLKGDFWQIDQNFF
jgi:hypothetical protein